MFDMKANNVKVGDKLIDNKGTVWGVFETDTSNVPYQCENTTDGDARMCWFTATGAAYSIGYGDLKLVGFAPEPIEEPKQTANKPHKHKDLIVAWANGAEVEYFNTVFETWEDCTESPPWDEGTKYRIKPEPKPDVVKYVGLWFDHKEHDPNGEFGLANKLWVVDHFRHQLKLTFCGETGKLKSAEVIS